MASEQETAEVLGLRGPKEGLKSALWMAQEVNKGLPLSSLERVALLLAPNDKTFVHRIVSKATLARRRKAYAQHKEAYTKYKERSIDKLGRKPIIGKYAKDRADKYASDHKGKSAEKLKKSSQPPALSPTESATVARVAGVWTEALHVWGSEDAARAFLFRPHPMLDGQPPIDVVLSNEFGRLLVEGILGRLQYGSAA